MYTLQTLPVYGWVIIALILICIVLGLLWVFVWGRRLKYPPGNVRTVMNGAPGSNSGQRAHVIIEPVVEQSLGGTPVERDLKATKLALRTSIAVAAIRATWVKNRHTPADVLDEVAVYFQSDAEFDSSDFGKKAAAYLWRLSPPIGGGIPMAIVRGSLAVEVQTTGEPIIHEMIHAVLGEYSKLGVDREHKDTAWKAVSGDLSEQAVAEREFKLRLLK